MLPGCRVRIRLFYTFQSQNQARWLWSICWIEITESGLALAQNYHGKPTQILEREDVWNADLSTFPAQGTVDVVENPELFSYQTCLMKSHTTQRAGVVKQARYILGPSQCWWCMYKKWKSFILYAQRIRSLPSPKKVLKKAALLRFSASHIFSVFMPSPGEKKKKHWKWEVVCTILTSATGS